MNIGRLDRRIDLQVRTLSTNEFNEQIETWATEAILWAEVRDLSATERIQAGRQVAVHAAAFKIRYRSTVTPATHRIVYFGQVYNIKGLKSLGRMEGLELYAEAVE